MSLGLQFLTVGLLLNRLHANRTRGSIMNKQSTSRGYEVTISLPFLLYPPPVLAVHLCPLPLGVLFEVPLPLVPWSGH
ncbi:hypothetical protein M404DRAFT_505725 [Pisolithus tinctorius Marx 270]|uniref:Secreted protein n=1 Tax=Pisolithus tinctorius Marx 270 TaxID=870435 RepID=A0A0C3NYI0_PISTI|nr:hypothetical protein M404DRAFT_505725 [Pisolithus tinctorius Marx 270]